MSLHVYPMISLYPMELLDLSSRYLSSSLQIKKGAQSTLRQTIKGGILASLTNGMLPKVLVKYKSNANAAQVYRKSTGK